MTEEEQPLRTIIITYADEAMGWDVAKHFLPTLRDRAKYEGEVLLLSYGMTSEQLAECEKHDITIEQHPNPSLPVPCARYDDIHSFLKAHGKDFDAVMTIDGGDVWFQEPFSELWEFIKENQDLGIVEENETCDEKIMRSWASNLPRPEHRNHFLFEMQGVPLRGAGMVLGTPDSVRRICYATTKLIKKFGASYFGVDLLAFNLGLEMLRREGLMNVLSLNPKYDYTLIHRPFKQVGDKIVVDGMLPPIIHNCGGNYRKLKVNLDEQVS